MKTETLRGQSTAGSLEEQVAYILRLPGMFEVEKQQWNTLQAEVLLLRAEILQISQSLDRFKEDVTQPEPTQNTRDVAYLSQELEWMQMEENHPESAAAGRARFSCCKTYLTCIRICFRMIQAISSFIRCNPESGAVVSPCKYPQLAEHAAR